MRRGRSLRKLSSWRSASPVAKRRRVVERLPHPEVASSREARPILVRCLLVPSIILLVVVIATSRARAAPAEDTWHDDFEGPVTSWQPAGADMQYRLEQHGLARGGAHTGQSSEQLRVNGGNGSAIYFSHAVPRSRIMPGLATSVWIKADRPGVQILGRIVLPNLIDPQTRQPVAVFVRGNSSAQVGTWEQLRIDNLPRELQHQVWVLNRQYGREVDARGAYLEQIWLNVFAGPGTTNVAIDDLDVAGIVPTGNEPVEPPAEPAADAAPHNPIARTRTTPANWTPAGGNRPAAHEVRLDGSVLLVDGHPFFPRILRYQGEQLDVVAKADFNTIRLDRKSVV